VINRDGTGLSQLTTHRMDDLAPAWNRDSTRIAFDSYRDFEYSIYVMDADGSRQRKLTTGGNGDWGAAFAPSGDTIVFASTRTGHGDIYAIDTAGNGPYRRLTHTDGEREMIPAFSTDGSKIAFVADRDGGRDIWVMNPDGSGQVRLTRNLSGAWRAVRCGPRTVRRDRLLHRVLESRRPVARIHPRRSQRDRSDRHPAPLSLNPMRATLIGVLIAAILSGCQLGPPGSVVGPSRDAAIPRQITFAPANDFAPAWADSRSIVYVSDQTGGGTSGSWMEGAPPRAHRQPPVFSLSSRRTARPSQWRRIAGRPRECGPICG
jgi:Tol biopolymer transport system component